MLAGAATCANHSKCRGSLRQNVKACALKALGRFDSYYSPPLAAVASAPIISVLYSKCSRSRRIQVGFGTAANLSTPHSGNLTDGCLATSEGLSQRYTKPAKHSQPAVMSCKHTHDG